MRIKLKDTSSENVELSFLSSYESLNEALVNGLGISNAQIKKFPLPKKLLLENVTKDRSYKLPINLINKGLINPEYEGKWIDTIFEDENFLVLSKPPFVHSHPLFYSEKNNCLSFIRKYHSNAKKLLEVNFPQFDRGLLHRLDFETSGVLIYIKNESIWKIYRENFETLVKKKSYLAIVDEDFKKEFEGEHIHFLRSTGKKGHKILATSDFRQVSGDFKEAKLSIKKLFFDKNKGKTLLKVELKTGSRHQIRTQLAALGYPILGDALYGGSKERRIFLHSYIYELEPIHSLSKYRFVSSQAFSFEAYFDLNNLL